MTTSIKRTVELYGKKYELEDNKPYSVFVKLNITENNGNYEVKRDDTNDNEPMIFDGSTLVTPTNTVPTNTGGKASRKRVYRSKRSTMKK